MSHVDKEYTVQKLKPPNTGNNFKGPTNLQRAKSRSFIQKQRLQRVVSRRFNKTGTKSVIQQALSQYLEDEEFDAKSMKSDLNDPEGYILDHLAHKFNWDETTKQNFFNEVSEAFKEENKPKKKPKEVMFTINEQPQHDDEKSKSPPTEDEKNHDTKMQKVSFEFTELRSESIKQRDEDILKAITSDINEEKKENENKNALNIDTTSPTFEDEDEMIDRLASSESNIPPAKKKTRYPEYVIKAIFYEADDQHVEVLLDQAINFIANDPRFDYLWHDEEFIKELYSDKTYSKAVERLMREIKDIEFTEKADFFHQFVYREYSRERKDYIRECMDAEATQLKHEKMQSDDSNGSNSNEEDITSSASLYDRDRTQSVSKQDIVNKYTLVYKGHDKRPGVDMVFKIRDYKKDDTSRYNSNKPDYFALPSIAPKSNFMWAQYQRKRIKREHKPMKPHIYWKLLKAEDFANESQQIATFERQNSTQPKNGTSWTKKKRWKVREKSPSLDEGHKNGAGSTQMVVTLKGSNDNNAPRKKSKKRSQIPLSHLNRILGLLRFYCKQNELEKNRTWLYEKGDLKEAFTFRDGQTHDRLKDKQDIVVIIQNALDEKVEYNIAWWNGGDALDNNVGIAIRKPNDPKKLFYFQCFKVDDKKIEWQWYNNDESYFQKFDLGFDAFAQLEASFQANLHSIFAWNIADKSYTRRSESPFNEPICPEMVKGMKARGFKSAHYYIIRYLFTKSKRIQDMEQLSINKNQPEYPRRIKRMIAGTNQNTLFAYFLTSSDFTDEWKRRFLLTEESQVYYFWAFVLSLATTMKYMELEMENQFVTFSFRRPTNSSDSVTFAGLDTSDLRREMRDLDLFDGFIVPPMQIMQTQDVMNNEDQMKPSQWYRTLSTVGILRKMKYYNVFDGTLRDKPNNARIKNKTGRWDTCPHDFPISEYPWEGELGTLYCDRCANMMRFGEYLRKFCLEYENRELIQFLWPWHKNTFHKKDRKKYHEAIARQNFNFLFDSEDLLNYVPKSNNKEEIKANDEEDDEKGNNDNKKDTASLSNSPRNMSVGARQANHLRNESIHRMQFQTKVFEAHIRHKRKYTARFMLGAWESLKNLNIIKVQMGAVFEQLEIDRVHAEVAAAAKESINIKFQNENIKSVLTPLIEKRDTIANKRRLSHDMKILNLENNESFDMNEEESFLDEVEDEEYEAKEWKNIDWPKWLSKWNTALKEKLLKNHWLMILKLNKFKVLDIDKMAPKQLPNWDTFLSWALSPIWKNKEYDDDSMDRGLFDGTDIENDEEDENDESDDEDEQMKKGAVMSEADLQKKMMSEWQNKFRKSWTRIPNWWHIGHDKVLIELAVQNMFNERKYYDDLVVRAEYYKNRLNQAIGEQDYTQDIAFQEFKNWCIRWENIMHRVRYISAVIARQLSSITPSIVELLIDEENDRPTWSCDSLVFLNDNQARTHYETIANAKHKPYDFSKTLKEKRFSLDQLSLLEDNSDEETLSNAIITNKFQKKLSVQNRSPIFKQMKKTKTFVIREKKEEQRNIDWSKYFKECRTRDPFMIRDLGFELKEILNTFDLVTYGEPMSAFVVEVLRTRNLPSLWTFLGVLLKTMPNKVALRVLYNNRTQLRRAKPHDLDWICRQVIQGTRFIVPACLFLSHFMRENAIDDLARTGVWEKFSKSYENFAAEQVSSIEDDFMLAVLMYIPVYVKQISLIQLALEQHNTLFLNTERVNRMITHAWFTANPLNPYVEMVSHKKNPKRNLRDAFAVLLRKPIYFYLTPFGYQWCITVFFTFYVMALIAWSATNSSASHTKHGQLYDPTISVFECIVWFMNFGFIATEFVQFASLGRRYFSVDGVTNVWDICMSVIWCILAGIRFSFLFGYDDVTDLYRPPISSFTRRRLTTSSSATKEVTQQYDKIYCPPNFFSCSIRYNDSCIAEVSSQNNQIMDIYCDDNDHISMDFEMDRETRRLFDDVIVDDFANFGPDVFYEDTAVDDAKASTVDPKTGLSCTTTNVTIPANSSLYFWNSTCLNYVDDDVNVTDLFATTSFLNETTGCILEDEVCVQTFDTKLLMAYNVLWAVQIAMLTMRLLSYFESAGGFFGILLRIVRAMTVEVLKFGVIIVIVSVGFLFAIWSLFSNDVDTAANNTFADLYDAGIFFFKLLFGGGNVGTIDTFYQNYRVFAQLLIMIFAILGVRMFMSLLIALMSGAMNSVRSKAKEEESFTSALYAYEHSTSTRVMPMPCNLFVVLLTYLVHWLNFIPALISPNYLNVYAHINQKRLYGFDLCASQNLNKRKNEIKCIHHMNTRQRVLEFYIVRLIPCLNKFSKKDWQIHHIGCYNTLIGIHGTEELQAVSTNEYYSVLETKRKKFEENRKLNVYDKLFLKHLTLKTLFCRYCFRPISLENIRDNFITPFDAMMNIISCYIFMIFWPFFVPFFWILCQFEALMQYWTEELRAHSPKLLQSRKREYDLEYFPRSAVKPLSVRQKTRRDFRRLGSGGPGVNDVDINYDEMDDAGA